MKAPLIIFVLLIGLCVVMGILFTIEEVPFEMVPGETEGDSPTKVYQGHGIDHPLYSSMKHGGAGAARSSKIFWLAWAFGALQIGLSVACLALGATRKGVIGPYVKPLVLGALLYIAVFTLLFLSYRTYVNEETHVLFLSQVKPTAWMLYGLWPIPLFFAALYTLTFESWYFPEEDIERFRQLMAEKNTPEEAKT